MAIIRAQSEVYAEVAKELGISKYEVEDAFSAQFGLVAEAMKAGEDQAVRLPLWGTFRVKERRREFLDKLKNGKTQRD